MIPKEIRLAAEEANLVIFVGASISRLMGCPSWEKFAESTLRQMATGGLITYGDIEQLKDLDAKKRLSIALQISEASSTPIDFQSLIIPKKPSSSRIYEYLNSIGCAYVTTNYDQFLEAGSGISVSTQQDLEGQSEVTKARELICWPHQFKGSLLHTPGSIIHLHGSVVEQKSMIITTPQYINHYNNEHVLEFLDELFSRYTVLFIGYGLEEWEILEHILRKGGHQTIKQKNRFMLSGYFSHQEKTFKHLYDFYENSYGVYLIPFSLDHMEYEQLEKILEDWSKTIEVGNPLLSDDWKALNEAAGE